MTKRSCTCAANWRPEAIQASLPILEDTTRMHHRTHLQLSAMDQEICLVASCQEMVLKVDQVLLLHHRSLFNRKAVLHKCMAHQV
jgi:hypothetical protein